MVLFAIHGEKWIARPGIVGGDRKRRRGKSATARSYSTPWR